MKKIFNIQILISLLFITTGALAEVEAPRDYEYVECELTLRNKPTNDRDTHPRIPGRSSEESDNWAGYAAFTNLTPTRDSVSYVTGTWNVPSVVSTPDDGSTAIWVGIDGYSSPTVEQLGTEHDWVNGKVQHSAWFEMYPNYSFNINGFPLKAGDSITATVKYAGNNVFILTIMNNTEKKFFQVPQQYTTSATAQRNSAEWIVEAPFLQKVLPLSHFSQINWTQCGCTINNATGPINYYAWQNQAITMGNFNPAVIKAVTSPLSGRGTRFNVVWKHE